MPRFVVLDTETTGVGAEDRIIDLYAIVIDPRSGETGASLRLRCNPQRPSHPKALAKHGITDAQAQAAPLFAKQAPQLLDFLANSCIIAHNAAFDARMLAQELSRLDPGMMDRLSLKFACTMLAAQEILDYKRWPSLDLLCDMFAVDRSKRAELHAAQLDVELLVQIIPKLGRAYQEARSLGKTTLGSHSKQLFDYSTFTSVTPANAASTPKPTLTQA